MLEYVIANLAISCVVCAGYFLIKKNSEKNDVPCNSCKWLIKRGGGGIWEYSCTEGGTRHHTTHEFDMPPKYCKYYKPIDEDSSIAMRELWCKRQRAYGKDIYCTAQLASGRFFTCPYKSNLDRIRAEHPCADYQKWEDGYV